MLRNNQKHTRVPTVMESSVGFMTRIILVVICKVTSMLSKLVKKKREKQEKHFLI